MKDQEDCKDEVNRLGYLMAAKDGNIIAGYRALKFYRDRIYDKGRNTTELNNILFHLEDALKIKV